ncbi:MAG TPA: glycoside hydrolase family 3 N-terminal domain-containing protein, partial [Candidatus Nanopelagicales bacterium]|nr:glycoside hydrolase family 3 N-terminal domain-containing protein [Candidatus Nanopelagicales bacterium]
MTASELDRRAHRVLLPGFVGTTAPDWLLRRAERGLGGVVLFARNVTDPDQVSALAASLRGVRPELLVAVDEEGGDVTRLEARSGSSYAGAAALGAADDVDLTRAVSAGIGAMLAGCGVDWTLAPVADVNSNPHNPVIGVRSFGADPELVARHVAAAVRGLQDDAGILACAKHFPGHGDTAVDSHLGLPVVAASPTELRTTHLAPFRAAIDAGVAT